MAGAQNELSVAERRRLREEERRRAAGAGQATPAGPEVAIAELANNPRNAREELEGLEGLAHTYSESGVLQSLAVIPADVFKAAFPENAHEVGDARYVVIGGNRRLAAARLAGLEQLPVLVNQKATTRKAILIAAATENVARQELKPFEELATIEELKAELGTYDAVAQALGKSAGWVSQRRRLHNLQPEVRKALEERTEGMTIELARDLGKIKDPEQQLAAWKKEKALAAARAAEPGSGKAAAGKSKAAKKLPKQSGDKAGNEPDTTTKERRDACAAAVAAFEGDASRLHIIALQLPTEPDEAVALASHWLGEAGIGASALSLPSLTGDEGHERQTRAALALSLAHCEIHLTNAGPDDPAHARAYLDWLATHADYQAPDAAHALTA
ncbi:ParB/RepB/Spo0J family partition protein [Streptomyces echinatus]|uniref:ParB/RepB/Spo0J family partition protein n=1 Tax=Streptomyces echinatus TaxID=67293 RepID=UPI00379AF6F0